MSSSNSFSSSVKDYDFSCFFREQTLFLSVKKNGTFEESKEFLCLEFQGKIVFDDDDSCLRVFEKLRCLSDNKNLGVRIFSDYAYISSNDHNNSLILLIPKGNIIKEESQILTKTLQKASNQFSSLTKKIQLLHRELKFLKNENETLRNEIKRIKDPSLTENSHKKIIYELEKTNQKLDSLKAQQNLIASDITSIKTKEKRAPSNEATSLVESQPPFKEDTPTKFSFKRMKEVASLKDHKEQVNCIISLQDGRLATSSRDKTIKIYNSSNFKCEMTIEVHESSVVFLCQLGNGYLVSSSVDKTIKVLEINKNNYQCVKTLSGHKDIVSKVIPLSQNRLASSSWDKTIKIWSSAPLFSCIRTLEKHQDCISSIIELKNEKYIVSASSQEECKLIFWDSSSYEVREVFENVNCCSWNSLIETTNNRLLVGGCGGIVIINLHSFSIEECIFEESLELATSFSLLECGDILCGWSKCYYLIDGENFKCCDKKVFHNNEISCLLRVEGKKLVSGLFDGTIKIWEY